MIGLMGLVREPAHYAPVIREAARAVTCPVMFIWQLEDELFTREECLGLFDALGSADKRLHANPGLHPAVPPEELAFSTDFLARHLSGTPWSREPVFRVSE